MFEVVGTAALVGLLVAPVLVALVALLLGGRAPRLIGQVGALFAGAGLVVAVVLALRAANPDVVSISAGIVGVTTDRLAVVLLMLIFGVSTVVQAFAVRYLAGDLRAGWFTAGAALLTAASAGLVTSSTLVSLALSWSVAGIALCLLLSTYWQLPTARDGVRRTATAFLFGDLALWAAVGLVTARRGTVALQDLGAKQFTGPLVPVVAVLVVIAALSRSAQIPFHRWLPATLAAPTPVSALLHAGVVNAGGILLVRLSPLATTEVAVGLTILAGATTMAYGAVIMLVKPDIKGALAHSTMAQMGFMILTCGLGLWAAAVIHLVAHGFYKATLFLSSGSAIAHHRRQAALPPAQRLTGRHRLGGLATALLLPLIALYAAVRLVGLPPGAHSAAQALLLFAEATGAATTWGWLQRRPDLGGAVSAAVFLLPAAVGYVAVIDAVSGFLAPALPDPTLPTTTILAIVTVALISLGGLAALWYSPAATPVQRVLYTRALSAGHLTPRPTGART